MLGKTLLTQTQTTKERERIVSRGWCLRFSLCAFAVLLWVCVCCRCCYRPSAFVVDFVSSRGMDWFVCVFVFCFCLKRALFLSLSFGSLTLSLSLAIVLPSYLHWSPPQFDYFYQKVLSFFYYVFLLPLICNNSCILRDATVCVVFVFVVCTVQKREVCPIVPACLRVCLVCCFCEGVWFFLLAIAQLVFCWLLGVAELFFYY